MIVRTCNLALQSITEFEILANLVPNRNCTLILQLTIVCLLNRLILDSLDSTDGTKINWRMMETVIFNVEHLDHLLDCHDGGEYVEGRTVALLHSLNWTNSRNANMHLVKKFNMRFVLREGTKGMHASSSENWRN